MSQNDFNIANQGFPATRADINSALQALASNSAGTAEPSTTYAYQFWYDETNELLKMRNSDNDAWITIGTFDQVADTFTPAGVTTDKIEEGNSSVEVVDTGTGYVAITVDGVEAARVDGSGNLLVGKTADSTITVGCMARADGLLASYREDNVSALFGRGTSDGDIAIFRRDGTTVGSIGANGGRVYTAGPSYGAKFGNVSLDPCTSTGSTADNAYDLGGSSVRWKNLYLSGGVYLGGTGAANYLDDYEEGTWTPVVSDNYTGGNTGSGDFVGFYTLIGNQCTVWCRLANINTSGMTAGNALVCQNLPFTSLSASNIAHNTVMCDRIIFDNYIVAQLSGGEDYVVFRTINSNAQDQAVAVSDVAASGGSDMLFTLTYRIS